jgi:hypothetical protein
MYRNKYGQIKIIEGFIMGVYISYLYNVEWWNFIRVTWNRIAHNTQAIAISKLYSLFSISSCLFLQQSFAIVSTSVLLISDWPDFKRQTQISFSHYTIGKGLA